MYNTRVRELLCVAVCAMALVVGCQPAPNQCARVRGRWQGEGVDGAPALYEATLRARDSALAQLTASDARRGADLAQCRDHNRELARLSSDLIDAIERGGMGEALVGTAPFSGYKRVRIETLVQDYRDRVAEQRVTDPKR